MYGGISVLIVGDLMQLRPPMADYVFGDPINADFYLPHLMQPIFEEFVYMKLSENHRHGAKYYIIPALS